MIKTKAQADKILGIWKYRLKDNSNALSLIQAGEGKIRTTCKKDIAEGAKLLYALQNQLSLSEELSISILSQENSNKRGRNCSMPMFFPTTTNILKHWEAKAESVEEAKTEAALRFENDLRKGLEASLEFLSTSQMKSASQQNLLIKMNEQGQCTFISGQAPSRKGTKTLYLMYTPSGRPVVVGKRNMGPSKNYCLYPMVTLDPTQKNWISDLPTRLNLSINYQDDNAIKLTGMHMTIPRLPNQPPSFFNLPTENGKDYITNGAHISFDLMEEKKKEGCRLQLKPRVEYIFDSKQVIARAGGHMLAHQVGDNRWPEKSRASLPLLVEATTRMFKNSSLTFLNGSQKLLIEQDIVTEVIASEACIDMMSVINELARIGRHMRDNKIRYEKAFELVKKENETYDGCRLNAENRPLGSPLSPVAMPFNF